MSIQPLHQYSAKAIENQDPMDEHKMMQRKKKLLLGRVTKGYLIMKASSQQVFDPIHTNCVPLRQFEASLQKWRRLLHSYDKKTVSCIPVLENVRQEIEKEISDISISKDFKKQLYTSLQSSWEHVCYSAMTCSSSEASASATLSSRVSASDSDSLHSPSRISLSQASIASSTDSSNGSFNDSDEDSFTSLYKQVEDKHPESISRISNPSIWR